MRILLLILLSFLFCRISYSQTFNLYYNYTEVCSEQQKVIELVLNLNSTNTIIFFGYDRTFTPTEIQNGVHIEWLNDIYQRWRQYYPCAEIKELVTDNAKSASEKSDVDISQPIVIMTADFGYKNGGVVSTTGGYNQTNLRTQNSKGMLLTMGSDYVGNIGYYRIQPLTKSNSFILNSNLLLLKQNVIANLTFGITGKTTKWGSYFGLHTVTFGNLNGYPFQDNTILLGWNKNILGLKNIRLSSNLILGYTYRVKVFNIKYWMEDHVNVKPFLNVGYKLTPTFGLNLSYTTSIRTDKISFNDYSILLGGRVLF